MRNNPAVLFVSSKGNDNWSGRKSNQSSNDGPFATLERARNEVRAIKKAGQYPSRGVIVEIENGTYQLKQTFELDSNDSGAAGAPVIYRAGKPHGVRLMGGKIIKGFQPVVDRQVLARLDKSARGKVMQVNLREQGINSFGSPAGNGLELFYRNQPMTLARWPNRVFTRIAEVVGGAPVDVRGTCGDKIGKFKYQGARPARWSGAKDIWLHGYWFWDWADERQQVDRIDVKRRVICLKPPHHRYGYRNGQWFYAFNILAELDEPGEWYLDRETGMLYFWPPAVIGENDVVVSVLSRIVQIQNAEHLVLEGCILEAARLDGVCISSSRNCTLCDCLIRNTADWGVSIKDGVQNTVSGCEVHNTGNGGIFMAGGNRRALTPAAHSAENNHIHHYGRIKRMYSPAISLNGVGLRAAHNLIHHAPHQALSFSGNDHVIELNEIHTVCTEANDAGAIYSGRDWTMRGTIIRHNFFYNLHGFKERGCIGVYLDDMFCGTTVSGNIFFDVATAILIGGGRYNSVANNIFVNCRTSVNIDARAVSWAGGHVETTLKERLFAMPYKSKIWREHYPELVKILKDEPALPKGNQVKRNVCWGSHWDSIEGIARRHIVFRDNLVGVNPAFKSFPGLNLQLKKTSPVYSIKGFKKIPFERIGLDPRRFKGAVPERVLLRVGLNENQPLVAGTGGGLQGSVRAELTVYGEKSVSGKMHWIILPETAGSVRGSKHYSYSIKPGERRQFTTALVSSSNKTRELTVGLIDEEGGAEPAWVDLYARCVKTIQRVKPLASVLEVPKTLENSARFYVDCNNQRMAELRFGITGESLVFMATVIDAVMESNPTSWAGSCIEIFGSMPGKRGIGQGVFVPTVEGKPTRVVWNKNGNELVASPSFPVYSRAKDKGYELLAIIPLECLNVECHALEFLFEVSINAAPNIAEGLQRVRLFGSPGPSGDNSRYALIKCTGI